jgi:hypothetical protein
MLQDMNAAAHTAATLAAADITIEIDMGYGLPRKQVKTTLGDMLGADHIGWILSQKYPKSTAESRAAGAWQANLLDNFHAYSRLASLL